MSVHTEISCNVCKKPNFKGKRYKCLRCFDYDMCSACFEANEMPILKPDDEPHNSSHAIQCIIPKEEFALYYGGEDVSFRSILSFTCPICAKMGFTEQGLKEHVAEHTTKQNPLQLVVCPICLAEPIDDTVMTDDIASHIRLEHLENDEEDDDDDDSNEGEDDQSLVVHQNADPTRINIPYLNAIHQQVMSLQRNVSESVSVLQAHTLQEMNSRIRAAEQSSLRQIISATAERPRVLRGAAGLRLGIPSETRQLPENRNRLTTGNSRQPVSGPPVIRVVSRSLDVPTAPIRPQSGSSVSRRQTLVRNEAIDIDFELAVQLQRAEENRARSARGEIPRRVPRSEGNSGNISQVRAAHEQRMAAFARRNRDETRKRYAAMVSTSNSTNPKKTKPQPEAEATIKEATETQEPQPAFILATLFKEMELRDNEKPDEGTSRFVSELLLSTLVEREFPVVETIYLENSEADAEEPKKSDKQ